MLKDEYTRLLKMIEQATDSEEFSLEEVLKEAVVFFEALRKEFPQASKEDREEMVHMMTHLHATLQEVSKKTAEAAGMSEEDLSAYAENPSNFTPEQWQMVQDTKRQLYDSARKFSSSIGKDEEEKKPHSKPVKKQVRRSRRNQWKKS